MRRSHTAGQAQIASLEQVFRRLFDTYGPQHWWPAETPFEIAVGAILVQRTAWRNVEQALAALRQQGLIDPDALVRADTTLLGELIRPAGFSNAKTAYLQAFARFVIDSGGLAQIGRQPTLQLRRALLNVHGVGPETADSMLLYLFERAVWIHDAYAARLLTRLSGTSVNHIAQDDWVSEWLIAERTHDLRELHALIVEHGKLHCRAVPLCRECPLLSICAHGVQMA